jgi:hypothetical protein
MKNREMKNRSLAIAVVLASLTLPALAGTTPISTIQGLYGVNSYDTPELIISNTTSNAFTDVTLTLTGYQGENNGIVQSQVISDIAGGTSLDYFWTGPTVAGNLFAYDYDDTGGNGAAPNPACVQGYPYCAYVGNFYVTFTATWNGESIYSQFSPSNNATGGFIGWEGLDPNGLAETVYDDHSTGGPNGVLANIYEGTAPPITTTPEPSTLMLLGSGLVGLAGFVRRRVAA